MSGNSSTAATRLKKMISLALALSALASPTFVAAATQAELEARVQALSEQLDALKGELAQLKSQHEAPVPSTPSGVTPVIAGNPGGTQSLQFFGYGELNYSRPRDAASATSADVGRFVIGLGFRFDERTRFVSELELEHAVSSSSDPGEIEVEQAYIEREITNGIYAKGGLLLIPSGMLNESHEPTRYYGVFRNFVETAIIPTTWREGGLAVQGRTAGGLRWDVGVTTGFDLSKWDATASDGQESPLGSIHQELALARAKQLSGFAALNYTGMAGLTLGASVFTGGAGQGQPGFEDAKVTLWEGHGRWTPGRWDLAGLYAHGHISDTQQINTTLVGNPTLIPENFFGWYLQTAYRMFDAGSWSLTPFVRYERFNTASSYTLIAAGLTPDVLLDQKVWTAGVNLMIAPGVVVKADYLEFENTPAGDRFDLGVGYQF